MRPISSSRFRLSLLSLLILLVAGTLQGGVADESAKSPKQIATIELPGVDGRIDHLTAAPNSNRLFIAAFGNNTIEIVDLADNKYVGRITGLKQPQGLAFDEKSNQLFAADGEGSSLNVYDVSMLKQVHEILKLPDADNVRVDTKQNAVLVAYGDGAIARLNMQELQKMTEVKVDGHPESFVLDDSQNLIYANVPNSSSVVVIDGKTLKVQARWHLPAAANYPMALHENKIFVGCRKPACLVVLDRSSGKVLQNLSMSGDCDDLFYDADAHRLYASCGEGFLDVYEQQKNEELTAATKIPTKPGARTSMFVPSLHRLYVAAPKKESKTAEILVFDTQDK